MARINTYQTDTTLTGTDKLIGTDANGGETKNFTLDAVAQFIGNPTSGSYIVSITDTATITHSLNSRDVIIQLYDEVTYETVYADVDRISTTQTTITFASTPANSVRVLVLKINE